MRYDKMCEAFGGYGEYVARPEDIPRGHVDSELRSSLAEQDADDDGDQNLHL